MDLRLTDLLACPRCGPPHGLVLLADRVEDRRVLEGVMGCPNCGGRWSVRQGLADLRAAAEKEAAARIAPEHAEGASPADAATRLAALMGLAGAGTLGRPIALVVGPAVAVATELAGAVPDLLVVAADPAVAGWAEGAGVERMLVGGRLPFQDRSLRGVTLSGAPAAPLVEEGLRVLHPLGRLVLEVAGAGGTAEVWADARARVARAGGRVLAEEGDTLVASPLPR